MYIFLGLGGGRFVLAFLRLSGLAFNVSQCVPHVTLLRVGWCVLLCHPCETVIEAKRSVMNELSPVLQLDESEPEESLKNYVPECYHGYLNMFTEKEAILLPLHQLWDHVVTLIPNAPPSISCRVLPSVPQRKSSKQSILRNKKTLALSENQSPHTQYPFSTSRKRMGVTALHSIIGKSMLSWSKTSSPSLVLTLLSRVCVEWYSLVNLISATAIGTFETVMKWRTLWHLKQPEGSMPQEL
jgi:hypothetical protein